MVISTGYTQRLYPEKKDKKAEKLRESLKLKDRNMTVVNRI